MLLIRARARARVARGVLECAILCHPFNKYALSGANPCELSDMFALMRCLVQDIHNKKIGHCAELPSWLCLVSLSLTHSRMPARRGTRLVSIQEITEGSSQLIALHGFWEGALGAMQPSLSALSELFLFGSIVLSCAWADSSAGGPRKPCLPRLAVQLFAEIGRSCACQVRLLHGLLVRVPQTRSPEP